jgi:hypothetical protein
MTEIGEGLISGISKIPQGLLELGASGVDLMADTDLSPDVTNFFNETRQYFGIDPVGTAGTITEVGAQFVVPAFGAASLVSKASNLGRLSSAVSKGKASFIPGSQLTTGEKFALGAQQVAAAGLADAIVATDGTTTIGDFFEGGPTQTDQEVGLSGREEAARRIANKLKLGLEGATAAAAIPAALKETAFAVGKPAAYLGEQISTRVMDPYISRGVRAVQESAPVQAAGRFLSEIERARVLGEEQGTVKDILADTLSIFRYRGMLPEEIATERSLIAGVGEAEVKEAKNILNSFQKNLDQVVSKYENTAGQSDTPLIRQKFMNLVEDFLSSPDRAVRQGAIAEMPQELVPDVIRMRSQIDRLSKEILNSDYVNRLKIVMKDGATDLKRVIGKNLNSYLRRRYRVFEDKNYIPTDETMSIAVQGFKNDPKATLKELQGLRTRDPEYYTVARLGLTDDGEKMITTSVTDDQAELAAKNFLDRYRVKNNKKFKGRGRMAQERLNSALFLAKKEPLEEYQRRLLGEIQDVDEAFLGTVADMAEFKAVDKFYGRITQLAETDRGVAKLFRNTDGMTDAQKEALENEGYIILGQSAETIGKGESIVTSPFGSLINYAVPERVYNDLTRTIMGDTNAFNNALRWTYSNFLRGKGAVQYGKTVLSPITQVRNVTSASLFALAQGNVGRGASLGESVGLVLKNIGDKAPPEALKELQELQSLGIIGTQAQLREIQELIKKGLATDKDLVINGLNVGRKFGSNWTDNSFGNFLGNIGKTAENYYQGGDDIWKIYNFKFEQNKLANALRGTDEVDQIAYLTKQTPEQIRNRINRGEQFDVDQLLKEEAADIVRNTVPNYNLAPEFIKGIRKLPVGNFVAFPYEIIRTGVNTINRGFKELASTNPNVQKIGMRRLMGAATTFYVLPNALSKFAYQATGVTEEEMEAYKRSLAAPWERNARLIPTGRDKDGLPTYINYSYTNPYDMLESVFVSANNKIDEGLQKGTDPERIVYDAAMASLSQLVNPFTEESIAYAKIRDVLPRQSENPIINTVTQFIGGREGQTVTGARVYNPEEDLGTQVAKSFAHIMDALIPSVVPVDVRGGELEASRFARSFMDATGMNELTGVSEKDRQGRERQFAGEITRALTGVTENTINAKLALKYKGYEFADARQNTSNIFNRVARRANLTNPQQLIDAYNQANEARYRTFNNFYQVVKDLRTIGMTDAQIRKALSEAGVGGADLLIKGRYEPLEISDTVIDEMRRNGTLGLLPRTEIRAIQAEQRQRPFGRVEPEPALEQPAEPEPMFGVPVEEAAPAAPVMQPAPQPQPAAPGTQMFGVPAPQSQSRNEVSPILVPDPVTRATFEGR